MSLLDEQIPRFRLACSVPHPEDGTSFYRAMGPLGAMAVEEPKLELVLPRLTPAGWELSWDWLAGCHALFLQRPFRDTHLQLAKYCKAMELPLWVDWDDDQRAVPKSNPFYSDYADSQSVRNVIWEVSHLADLVTCSTPHLAKTFDRQVRVIPNGNAFKFYNEPRARRVSWRGAAGHEEDICTVLGALSRTAELPQFSMWRWFFMGDIPWQVNSAIPAMRLEQAPGALLHFMVPLLALQAPYVHIVPLKDFHFNRCKSNIAWIEATCAGAAVLAPDFEEWRRPGVVNYTDPKDFEGKLVGLMESYDNGRMHPNVTLSRAYIHDNLGLGQLNRERYAILNQLWSKRKV
jgi:hypothetical protein